MFNTASDPEEKKCQSCGMSMSIHTFGTNASGSMNFDYCMYCFQKGGFTEPDIEKSEVIRRLAKVMEREMVEKEAFLKAEELVNGLKRWRIAQ